MPLTYFGALSSIVGCYNFNATLTYKELIDFFTVVSSLKSSIQIIIDYFELMIWKMKIIMGLLTLVFICNF